MLDRHDLTDEEWARLEPLLPDRRPRRGGRRADHRQLVNGVFWRTRCGLPWRDVWPQYGRWKTVYNRHRRCSGDGTWVRVLNELRRDADTGEGQDWVVGVDSGVVRGHQQRPGPDSSRPSMSHWRSSSPSTWTRGAGSNDRIEPRGSAVGDRPPGFNVEVYKQRNVVERAINKLKGYRAVATRYEQAGLRVPRNR